MRLVERHIVKDNRFEDICLKSGLLYNYVLYNIRQEIFSGNYLKEFDLSNKLCKENQFDFRNLPNHVSQQVIKQVFKNIKSWMRLKKDFEKNPSKYGNHRPHLPSYKQPEIKDIFEKCGAKKPDKATWGDVQYVFAMYYSDGFPKVFKCENELVKATLMYLDDPDAPEGVAFIRWLAVQDYLGEKINWKDLT